MTKRTLAQSLADTVEDSAALPLRELFRFDTAASVTDFAPIDDRVMGGRSVSRLRQDPAGHAVFEGDVSLSDGGGFASVRSRPLPMGHAGASLLCVEVFGDGKRYKLNLRTDALWDGVAYQAVFQPVPGAWQVMRLPLASFAATRRGRPVLNAPDLERDRLCQLGLTIGDRQAGAFSLALRVITLE